ncbi:MAG: HAMP domain-containing histidine kinase [Bacteroidales bacterium]|nr:HAMP domain-containing histidine kinase [Bacteroidales bacterium]
MEQINKADSESVEAGQALLKKYGYNSNNILFDIESIKETLSFNTGLSILFSGIICIILIFIFHLFLRNQYRRINEVTNYAKQVQAQDYSLDIRDNSEGDISMLKNEIYKITTMLREQAESLKKDKLGLSNSIADISHQLKTPLTSLFVLNDLLASNPDPDTKQEFLQRIDSQLERMQWLVSSLLKLSKLDAGTVEMKKEAISARTLTERALESLKVQIDQKDIEVLIGSESDGKPALDMDFTGDFNWTLEAVTNILKNCVEHTPTGGQINISFENNPIYHAIIISDNGVGIDKEDLPHIFQRFYKGKNASDDSIGIGLAMAKAIVNEQNGDITIKSEPGQGTTFTIQFFK